MLPELAPRGKNIAVGNVPFVFVKKVLCPVMLSIGTLKILGYLKGLGNQVAFLDSRSQDRFLYVKRPAGLQGSTTLQTHLVGRSKAHFEQRLDELPFVPDEMWFTLAFSADYPVLESMLRSCRKRFPNATLRVGGDGVAALEPFSPELGVVYAHDTYAELEDAQPDFSVYDQWDYGLFQLTLGCPQRCTFCTSGLRPARALPVDGVVAYMRAFHDRYHPGVFWCWDPNVLTFRKPLAQFLERYRDANIGVPLRFGKGFQPNLLTEDLAKLMVEAGVTGASFPFEAASSAAIVARRKPYTILSSIRALDLARRHGMKLDECWTPFVFGYPDDDLRSIFRLVIASWKLGGRPLPFPVFLFPLSEDFERYQGLVAGRDPSLLHGQLWPLVDSDQVPMYEDLFTFLDSRCLEDAERRLGTLPQALQDAFGAEKDLADRFLERALAAQEDTLGALQRIESELLASPNRPGARLAERPADRPADRPAEGLAATRSDSPLPRRVERQPPRRILSLVANPKPLERSVGRQLAQFLLERVRDAHPGAEVLELDLYREGIRFLTEEYVDALANPEAPWSAEVRALMEQADRYIALLREADRVVVVCPMWTLTIPAILKAFFELVSSRLFYCLGEKIYPKPIIAVLTRDGRYEPGDEADDAPEGQMNVQERTLLGAFDFLGMGRDLRYVYAQGLYRATPEQRAAIVGEAKKQILELVEDL